MRLLKPWLEKKKVRSLRLHISLSDLRRPSSWTPGALTKRPSATSLNLSKNGFTRLPQRCATSTRQHGTSGDTFGESCARHCSRYVPAQSIGYHADTLQESLCNEYAEYFRDKTMKELDELARSFELGRCVQRDRLNGILKAHRGDDA
jgi:hypothetical protein